jgi:hypothetical protein
VASDGSGALGRDGIARALRDSRGSRFFAIVEGEAREVKTAKTRGRWERLTDAAILLGASRIEARDDDGATLAVVQVGELDDEPSAPEAAPAPERTSAARDSVAEVERLLVVVLKAQDHALSRHAEQTRAIVDASVQVMTASAERASSLERAVLALVQQRERDLEAAHESLAAEARASMRAAQRAKPDEGADEDQAAFDAMGRKLLEEHVLPVVGARIATKLGGGSS